MIDEALEQIAHKAMARRSRRAARKESRRRLRAERKAEHHELRAGRKAAPATRVAKTGSDVFHARKRKASAKLDAVVNEMKLEDKDPIIARCDDVLDEMKRKAVRRALRAERQTECERKKERKAVRLAKRAERKAKRAERKAEGVGRRPTEKCEQRDKKAGRGPGTSAPARYTPFVPIRVQKVAHAIARATADKAATNDEMNFQRYDADDVRDAQQQDGPRAAGWTAAVRNTAQLRDLQDSRKRGPRRRADGSKREPRQWCADYPALQVHQHHPQCPPALPLPPPPPPLLAHSAIVAPSNLPVAPAAIAVPQQPTGTPTGQTSPGHQPHTNWTPSAPITPAIVASPILPVASAPAHRGFPTTPRFSSVGTIVSHSNPFELVVHWQVDKRVTTSVPCNAVAREDVRIHDFGSPGAPAMRVVKNGNFRFSESTRQWLPMDSHL